MAPLAELMAKRWKAREAGRTLRNLCHDSSSSSLPNARLCLCVQQPSWAEIVRESVGTDTDERRRGEESKRVSGHKSRDGGRGRGRGKGQE